MDYKAFRIIFMGTPDFAVASLQKLLQAGCNIVGVVTAPDKPAGRGMDLQESPVKQYAVQHGLTVLQPIKLKDPAFIETLQSLQADLQIVVAFRMLPEVVWGMPRMGTVNVHGSLLPQYRGAAPINWAIINGESLTGVTTFRLQHEIDTGNILLSEKIWIGENETAGSLHDRMKDIGASLLLETIQGLANGAVQETPQSSIPTTDENTLRHAPKIFTETCRIDWNNSVADIYNLIRGLSPYPTAFTLLEEKKLKIFKAKTEMSIPAIAAGELDTDYKTYLKFACKDGYIHVEDIQLEGKKQMDVASFLRGYRFGSNK